MCKTLTYEKMLKVIENFSDKKIPIRIRVNSKTYSQIESQCICVGYNGSLGLFCGLPVQIDKSIKTLKVDYNE